MPELGPMYISDMSGKEESVVNPETGAWFFPFIHKQIQLHFLINFFPSSPQKLLGLLHETVVIWIGMVILMGLMNPITAVP